MGILQSTAFKLGCKYYNWRNGTEESGSSDTQGLQNPEEGGSTSRIRHEEPLIPKIWQAEVGEQMILPFKPSRLGRFQNTWSSTADPNTVVHSSTAINPIMYCSTADSDIPQYHEIKQGG